jgi:hypothetical protein
MWVITEALADCNFGQTSEVEEHLRGLGLSPTLHHYRQEREK